MSAYAWAYGEDLFALLGIDRNLPWDEQRARVVTRTYRQRCLGAHPDHGGADKGFKLLQAAYAILSDAEEYAKWCRATAPQATQ